MKPSSVETAGWMVACFVFSICGAMEVFSGQARMFLAYTAVSILCRMVTILVKMEERGKPDEP